MKYRQGFVTNSSSTSFIIAIKGTYHDIGKYLEVDEKWRKYIAHSIERFFTEIGYDESELEEIEVIEDKDRHRDADSSYAHDNKDKIKQLLADGFSVYRKTYNHHNQQANELLKIISDNKNIILIDRYDG